MRWVLGQKRQKTGIFEGCRNGTECWIKRNQLEMSGLAGKDQKMAFFNKNGMLAKKRQFDGMGLGTGLNPGCLPCLG
jgi:hypothetical protein